MALLGIPELHRCMLRNTPALRTNTPALRKKTSRMHLDSGAAADAREPRDGLPRQGGEGHAQRPARPEALAARFHVVERDGRVREEEAAERRAAREHVDVVPVRLEPAERRERVVERYFRRVVLCF